MVYETVLYHSDMKITIWQNKDKLIVCSCVIGNLIDTCSWDFPSTGRSFSFLHTLQAHLWIYIKTGDWLRVKDPHWKCQQFLESEPSHMVSYSVCLNSDNQFSGVCWLTKPECIKETLTGMPHACGREPLHMDLCQPDPMCHLLWLVLTPYLLPLCLDLFYFIFLVWVFFWGGVLF